MNKDKRNFNVLLVLSFLACLTLGWYSVHQYQVNITRTQQLAAITDTVRLYKTKTGASGAERKIIVGTRDEALAVLKNTDSKAYDAVKNTNDIHSYTHLKTVTRIDTVVKADTVYMTKDSTGKLDYILAKTITEPKGFYSATVNVHRDSVGLKLQMYDKYTIISKEKSNGLLRPKSYVVTVENENPYVQISDVKSIEITPKPKIGSGFKIGGVAIAIGIGAFFLFKH